MEGKKPVLWGKNKEGPRTILQTNGKSAVKQKLKKYIKHVKWHKKENISSTYNFLPIVLKIYKSSGDPQSNSS